MRLNIASLSIPNGGAEPGITYLGITESDIMESGGIWKVGNRYNEINYNRKVESDITETGITESVITASYANINGCRAQKSGWRLTLHISGLFLSPL